MTPLERRAAFALGRCSFPIASWSKRFGRALHQQASQVDPRISERQAVALWRNVYTYRRQISDPEILEIALKTHRLTSCA